MKIDNKFVIYKTIAGFNRDVAKGKVQDDSIVFVIEDNSIRTHGLQFGKDIKDKGFFVAGEKLPVGKEGDYAVVKEGDKWYLYVFDKDDGWVKTEEYGMPDITKETLDQYIRKDNIQAYLRDIYNDTYVRRDEVYTPEQEDWDHQAIDEHDEWQWDEEYNLYKVDVNLSTTSRNAVQNRTITNKLLNKKDSFIYDEYAQFLEDLDHGLVPEDAVIYIKDKALIYAFGTYFSGGSGSGGGVPVTLNKAILYRTVVDRDAPVATAYQNYNAVQELPSSKTLSIELNGVYPHIAVPTTYSILKAVTSNNETLSVEDDFQVDSTGIIYPGDSNATSVRIYKYLPVTAPDFTLILTFNIPE